MRACEHGHVEAARLLLQKGANINAQDLSAASCICGDAVASDPVLHSVGSRGILRVV